MAQRGNVYEARSTPEKHFTEALAPGASESETFDLPPSLGSGGIGRSWIRQIHLFSLDNCAWEINFYGKSAFETLDIADNSLVGRYRFQAAQGVQIVSGGLYHYLADDLSLPYENFDRHLDTAPMHALLVNRSSATTKSAGASFLLKLLMEPACGW